jgi:hypothetical protein
LNLRENRERKVKINEMARENQSNEERRTIAERDGETLAGG